MANGFGDFLSPEFRERNRETLRSIESGPSLAEVQAEGFQRGITAGDLRDASSSGGGPEESGIGLGDVFSTAGRVLEGVATLGTSELRRARAAERREKEQLVRRQMRAKIQAQDLANTAQALGIVSEFSKQIAQVDDPEKRSQIRESLEPRVREFGIDPQLFDSMVENQHLAFIEQEEQLSRALKHSRTAQRWISLGNSFADAPKDMKAQMMEEWGTGEARDFISKGRPIAKRLLRRFEQDFPQRFQQMQKSDGAITTDEFSEVISQFQSSEPDISDPEIRTNLDASVRRFPESYGLKPQADVERRRELVEQESVQAAFREPSEPDLKNMALPDGRRVMAQVRNGQAFIQDSQGNFTVPAPPESQIVGTSITGTAEEVFPGAGRSAEASLDASARVADSTRLLSRLRQGGPGVSGVRGFLTENVAGGIAQINERLGDMTAKAISGTSLSTVQEFQTEARRMVAQSVSELTGEESGRITDRERTLAEQASALVQPGKSFQQTQAGLVTLQKLAVLAQDRNIIQAGGTPAPLETDEQKRAELRRLIEQLNMTPADAADTVRSILQMREQLGVAIRGITGREDAGRQD